MLAAAPPLATSLSAPSESVFIVLGSGAGAAELAQHYQQHTESLPLFVAKKIGIQQYGTKCMYVNQPTEATVKS